MNPKVSVAIATYNYARYLPAALDSVLDQTFQDLEIVVVDDGSTDETAQVIQPYLKHQHVRYLQTEHLGHPAAKNVAIRNCQAPLLAFLDADDIWLPAKIEKQVQLFEDNPNLGVAYTRRHFIDENGSPVMHSELPVFRGCVIEQMFLNNFVCFSSSMVSRKAFDEHGILDESIPDNCDYELWLRIARTFTFDFINEPLVKYRTGHANLTQQAGTIRLRKSLQIMDRFLSEYCGRKLISPSVVRRGYAETYCHLGQQSQKGSRLQALTYYLKSLSYRPFQSETWMSIVKCVTPQKLHPLLKQLYRTLFPSRHRSCQAS